MPRGFATIDRRSVEIGALVSCAALAALGVWLLVRLVWLIVPRDDAVLEGSSMRVGNGTGPAPAQSIAKWHLFGNTPAVARRAYIDPRVFDRYRSGSTISPPRDGVAALDGDGARRRRRIERAVLELLTGDRSAS